MKVKFWGVRGSIPTSLTAEEVEDKIISALQGAPEADRSDPAAMRAYLSDLPFEVRGTVGGNTSCVQVLAGPHLIVLDAGSGLRRLGLALMEGECGRGEGIVHLFLTHLHWDHIQGFPFFAPLYVPGNRIFIYSLHKQTEKRLLEQQKPEHFPLPPEEIKAEVHFSLLGKGEISLGEVRISNFPLKHPGDSYSYRIEYDNSCLVYATDGEYQELDEASIRQYVNFFRGADALIFDAQYLFLQTYDKEKRQGWGHSSGFSGVDLAVLAGVKKLILFHHDPSSSDRDILKILEDTRQSLAPGHECEVLLAYEGLELEL